MRKHYLDNIRWATVVLVVIFHVIYMFNGVAPDGIAGAFSTVQYQDAVQYLLYPWFMVILFMVSGICSKYYLDSHSDGEFIRSRTVKLLVPSTIGLLIFQWIQGMVNMKLGGAFETMPDVPKIVLYFIAAVSGTGVLWYIQMLWIFSVLLVLVRKIEKGRFYNLCGKVAGNPAFLLLSGIAAYGAAQILNTPVVTVYRFGIYSFAFFFGCFILTHEKAVDCLVKFRIPLAFAAVALGAVYTVKYFGQNFAAGPAINCPLAMAYMWCACLGIIGLAKKYADFSNRFTQFMSRKSWGLYVFHYLPVSVCGLFLPETGLPPILVYIITGISAVAVALLLYEIISRIPFFRWCVLGIKKEKKNVQ